MIWAYALAGFTSSLAAWSGQKWAPPFESTRIQIPWGLSIGIGGLSICLLHLTNTMELSNIGFSISLFACLSFIVASDIRCGLISNLANICLAFLAIIWTFGLKQQSVSFWALGTLFGGGLLWAVRIGFKRVRGIQGLGFGDVKLMAAGGGLIGPLYIGHALALGAGMSLIWLLVFQRQALVSRTTKIPFGPGLCFGIAAFWVYQVRGGIYDG